MNVDRRFVLIALFVFSAITNAYTADSLHTLFTITGEYAGQHLGRVMSGAGDINGDGFADLIVGDEYRKECRIYLGGTTLPSLPSVVISRPETCPGFPPCDFGCVVSGVGDINGDGFDDFIVTNAVWFYETGKVYVYFGGVEIDTMPDVAIAAYGSSWLNEFWSTDLRGRMIGDINGDGYDELACLSYYTQDVGAFVYFGGAPMDSVHDVGCRGPGYPYLELGSDVSSGDLNGDGFGDLVVGAYAVENHPDVQDAAWIYLGGEEMDDVPDFILSPSSIAYNFSVDVPGDFNGDGFRDLVVAPSKFAEWDDVDFGTAYIYFGSTRFDNLPDLELPGGIQLGAYRLAGGDLNLDGFTDLIITQVSYDSHRLALYFGGVEMDAVPNIEILGSGSFGETLSWIGDMNGDGWPEIAVSDPMVNAGRGEIYIYTMAEVRADPDHLPRSDQTALHITPNPSIGPVHISWYPTLADCRKADILDIKGRKIRCIQPESDGSMIWDGRDSSGYPVSPGTYVLRIEVGDHHRSERIIRLK